MLVYEKNNKLNISFENNLNESDIEIGKSEINVDGNNIANSGSSSTLVVHATDNSGTLVLDKTWQEIYNSFNSGAFVYIYHGELDSEIAYHIGFVYMMSSISKGSTNYRLTEWSPYTDTPTEYSSLEDPNSYPTSL